VDSASFDSFIRLADSLRELEITVGPAARPVIAEVRERLAEASARRAAGDMPAALERIRSAMERMSMLAGMVDPSEAMLMRLLTDHFTNALKSGDKNAAKTAVNTMRHKAGDPKNDPDADW
jgi:hypothetical protein